MGVGHLGTPIREVVLTEEERATLDRWRRDHGPRARSLRVAGESVFHRLDGLGPHGVDELPRLLPFVIDDANSLAGSAA